MDNTSSSDPVIDQVVADCIASRVRLINRVVSALYDEALRPHGLRISQANILVALAHRGETRPAEVCQLIRIEKSTLSRDVELMKQRGWVESDPPEGGRNQTLRVTAPGRELLRAIQPGWEQAQTQARQCLGDPGVAAIHAMANRLGFGRLDH